VADYVTIRHPHTGETREVSRDAVPFFPDFEVLTADGRVNAKATAAAHGDQKGN
jgi:hypothetical protein